MLAIAPRTPRFTSENLSQCKKAQRKKSTTQKKHNAKKVSFFSI